MKITPIEIRQREFERHFRGYDKDEVNAFLQTLSQAWESLLEENKETKNQLGAAQKELAERRDAEGSLFRTLRTAEETGANIIDRAHRDAEQRIQAAEEEAERIINQAKAEAQKILAQTDGQAQQVVRHMEEKVAILQQDYRRAKTSYTEVLSQLTDVAEQALRAVEYAENNAAEDITSLVEEAHHIKASYQPPVTHSLEEAPVALEEIYEAYEENDAEVEEKSYAEEETYEPESDPKEEEPVEAVSTGAVSTGAVSTGAVSTGAVPARPAGGSTEPVLTEAAPSKKRGSFFDEID